MTPHEPLVIAEQGHFFTGLDRRTGPSGTAVTGMHVEYQIPAPQRHPCPLVMVHGGGGQGLDLLATPRRPPGRGRIRRRGCTRSGRAAALRAIRRWTSSWPARRRWLAH